ncbi:anti-sigma factor [uncultured Devosia sp.]|jgi:anti-sigma-K factor RskA|uniref:anti-sigma factor n=1 Tax=Devosia sp. TaxID=1871048 RepID=UPI0030EC0706|tara:strand:+ start:33919 stop:34614 length:696 start_codon:yes stop_codon:yes gene_type:complete
MTQEEMERAGEYVLGLLGEAEAKSFEAEMAQSAALAGAVARLREHMAALDDTAAPVPANPDLWRRIEAQLGPQSQSPAQPTSVPANDNSRLRWLGMAASVFGALGIGYLAGMMGTNQQQPMMIAVLMSDNGGQPGAIVEAFADDSLRLVPLDTFAVPEGRVLEIWTLHDPAIGPVSLGTFNASQTIRLTGPDLPPPQSGQLYEITLEPAGGSPIGRPTGPILVKGFAKAPL